MHKCFNFVFVFIKICAIAIDAFERHFFPEPLLFRWLILPVLRKCVSRLFRAYFGICLLPVSFYILVLLFLFKHLGVFQVWDKDTLSPDDFIGRVSICLNQICGDLISLFRFSAILLLFRPQTQ